MDLCGGLVMMEPLLCPCQNKRNKWQSERIDDCVIALVAGRSQKSDRYVVSWKDPLLKK